MNYQVQCYSAPYENTSFSSLEKAIDLCYNLSEEYGLVEVIEWVGGYRQCIASYNYGR